MFILSAYSTIRDGMHKILSVLLEIDDLVNYNILLIILFLIITILFNSYFVCFLFSDCL